MRRALVFFTATVVLALSLLFPALGSGKKAEAPADRGCVLRAELDGIVSSGTASYLTSALEAADARCGAVLIVIDTPGGELQATREIVSALLTAEVPVVTYVAPRGARAGSAGVFIEMAGHVAAMSPGTNIGAAHPVVGLGQDPEEAGEELGKKIVNDVAAFARAIAQERGRNVDWAEKAVRQSVSVTAAEAVKLDIVDLVSGSEEELLTAIDGRTVEVAGGEEVTLRTAGADIREYDMTLRERALAILGNPNLAYLLLMVGMLGLLIELFSPGLVIPGAAGAFCLLLAAIGLNILPISVGAVILLVIGVALLVAELYVTSYGLLTAGGLAALVAGSLLLIDRESGDYFADASVSISWGLVMPLAVVLVGTAAALAYFGSRSQLQTSPTGAEGLVGRSAEVVSDVGPRGGYVLVDGERWRAVSGEMISAGSRVTVTDVRGLSVVVSRDRSEEVSS